MNEQHADAAGPARAQVAGPGAAPDHPQAWDGSQHKQQDGDRTARRSNAPGSGLDPH